MFFLMNVSNYGCFVDVLFGVIGIIFSYLERKMGEGV